MNEHTPEHTPAPWDIDWYECKTGTDFHWRVPKSIGPIWVEHNHWAGHYIDLEEPDAYLIAAAPDMLEALEAINEELCYGISDSLDALKDVATAAINKAKGEL